MSLNDLRRRQTPKKSHVRKDVAIMLPPEYDFSPEEWSAFIHSYNLTDRPVRLATMFIHFIRSREPEHKDFDTLLTVGEITEKDNQYYVDLFFESNRAGLTALILFEAEPVSLVPVCNPKNNLGITHLSLVYTPT